MADGYRVNTDELEAVVKRLRALQQGLSECGNKAKYNTVLVSDDFGANFDEAKQLFAAHSQMQQFLSQHIQELDSLINDFGDKTHSVNTAYRTREEEFVASTRSMQSGKA
ncbi:hypothetical protein [Kitasatospora sp. NPDC085879]|uniref:hypothetical protein n=1 Tax=Kitasatospora sp. NPDC085879 TaxID=3154769 RepID=UPI00343F048D